MSKPDITEQVMARLNDFLNSTYPDLNNLDKRVVCAALSDLYNRKLEAEQTALMHKIAYDGLLNIWGKK